MSNFSRLRSDGRSTTLAPPEERAIAGEELWWPPGGSAGVVVTEQTALQSAALLAAVGVISTDTAVLPLCVCQRMPDGSHRAATEHPAHELVARSPNGEATPMRWRQSLVLHALIYGNGFAEVQRLGSGRPYALHLLDPSSTTARRDAERKLYYESGTAPAGSKKIPAADVLHVAGLGFDGISGYNMVRLLRQSIGLSLAGETFAADFFANGSESGGVIEVPGRLKDEDAVRRLRDRWEGRHQGAGRRHRVAVLEEGAKYTPTGTEPEKSQLLDTRKFQVIDTVRCWRVPPHKVGDFSQAHLANIEASNLDYLMTALMGWLTAIEQEFDLKLLSRKEWSAGYRFRHDVSALLRGDLRSRFDAYSAAIRDGWMSRNEVRARENMDPIPDGKGGDLYTVQMQIIPLGTEPEKAPTPAPTPTPDPAGRSERRFNPNHGATGKFASGHGAGARGPAGHVFPDPAHLDADLAPARAAAVAAAPPGTGAHVASGPPLNPRDRQALALAREKGREAVRVTEHPHVDALRDGGITSYRVGGKTAAHVQANEDGSRWALHTYTHSGGAEKYPSSYRTREKAEANAEKFARRYQREKQTHAYHAPADVAAHLTNAVAGTSPHHDSYAYVIRGEQRSERRFNPNHGEDGKFAGGHGGGVASKKDRRAYTDAVERRVASEMGGRWLKDQEPVDVEGVPKADGTGFHHIEVKTRLDAAKKEALSVGPAALLDKADYARARPHDTVHTVLFDKRAEFEGGQHAAHYSGHEMYYKRAAGAYTPSNMHKVKDYAELKRLLDTPDRELPRAARGKFPRGKELAALRPKAAKEREYNNARSKARKERLGAAAYGR